jgi:hypothetical protein
MLRGEKPDEPGNASCNSDEIWSISDSPRPNCLWAIQDIGSHDGTVLGEGIGKLPPTAMGVSGRNLRPDPLGT